MLRRPLPPPTLRLRRRCCRGAAVGTGAAVVLLLLPLAPAAPGPPEPAAPPPPCTLADCKDPARHDQCRKPCGPGFRPGCTYCTSDPTPRQCSHRCSWGPQPHPGPDGDPCGKWYASNRGLIAAPASRAARPSWWAHVLQMRADCQRNSDRSIYNNSELQWTATNYVQPQMHPFDLFFYDPAEHRYTVTKYLDDLDRRYGGVDSILLWPTWPNIGIDSRSQFDLFASLPGGLPALRSAIRELHERGVKTLLPYNPWDQATRRPPSGDDATALALLRNATGSDGINADSTHVLPQSFYAASPGGAIEPEHEGDPPCAPRGSRRLSCTQNGKKQGVDRMRTWHTLGWSGFLTTSSSILMWHI